jgi:hypothetical protein
MFNTEKGGEVEFVRPADPERGKRLAAVMEARHDALALAVASGGSPLDFPQEGNGPRTGFPCDWCEYVTVCWPDAEDGMSPQASSIVDDPELVAEKAATYLAARDEESQAKKRKDAAFAFLRGIVGEFGEFRVTQTPDGEGEMVLDEESAIDLLKQYGEDVPVMFKPGRRGYPRVTRLKR